MTDRDQFAAAALTGLLSQCAAEDREAAETAAAAMRYADAMLRCRSGGDCPLPDNAPNHDAAPAATADSPDERPPHAVSASAGTPSAASRDGGTGDTQEIAAYARFVGQVMNWISEATSAYAASCSSDGDRKILADACSRCWDAFDRIAYPTVHGASPEARASVDSVAPQPTTRGESDRRDKAAPRPSEGTGDTTEPAAWGVMQPNGDFFVLTFNRRLADDHATASDRIVPLYRHPQATLTDAEREAIEVARSLFSQSWKHFHNEADRDRAAALSGFLERHKRRF